MGSIRILGISAYYHDSAAALIIDGEVIAAAQEERFTRVKHDPSFPVNAIKYCLYEAKTSLSEISFVVFYDKPFLKFERLLETYVAYAPRGFQSFRGAMVSWIKDKLFQKNILARELRGIDRNFDAEEQLLFSEHHQSHAASAYFPSPFEEAAIITMDGVGEWCTSSVSIGKGNSIELKKEILFPHSLGLLYSAFTYYLGFKVNSGEYKMMGLAPYGEPKYVDKILANLLDLKTDGSFRLNMDYFNYCTGLTMTNKRFDRLFGVDRREPENELTQFHMDIAASIQRVTEEVVIRITRAIYKETNIPNLCLAGGVALNCVANGKISRDGHFKNIWIQPAAGDSGAALGAALLCYHWFLDKPRTVDSMSLDSMKGSYLGPSYEQSHIEMALGEAGAVFDVLNEEAMFDICVDSLVNGNAVGWFQGRMEFGPRALGARSILADPRSSLTQSQLNMKVKFRESFRPFAPSVLREDAGEWFDLDGDSPYMLLVDKIARKYQKELTVEDDSQFGLERLNVPRSEVPAVTHVDLTARIQTVHSETTSLYHRLLVKFRDKTGCPILVNTSFNVRGEPIVCSPVDAFNCFMGTGIDVLAIGNCILKKEFQNPELLKDYREGFELD
jgi:carbamoyltransferase